MSQASLKDVMGQTSPEQPLGTPMWKRLLASPVFRACAALGLILVSPSMYTRYGLDPDTALIPFSNPGLVSIPLSFITLVVVSLMTQKKAND